MHSLERSSVLAASAEEVWARAVTPAGINDELRPLLRMTMPAAMRGRTIADLEPGEPLGRSWLLLGGILPVDFDDLCLDEIEELRFLERSRMLSFSVWQHERSVERLGDRECRVTDTLSFELRPLPSRVPGASRLAAAIVGAVFRHRHRRLARHWGVAAV